MWGITHNIHPVTARSVLLCNCFSAINYILRNSGFPTYLNHFSLKHRYQYSPLLHCHCLITFIHLKVTIKILGIVLCYQYQMMISLWISLSFWNIIKPFPFLPCYYLQKKVTKDKEKVISKEHRSSPKIYYPEYIILICKVWSSVIQCWLQKNKIWQEELFSCANLCGFQWNE